MPKLTKAKTKLLMHSLAEGMVAGKTKAAIAKELGMNARALGQLEKLPEFQGVVDELIAERRRRTTMQLEVMSALALRAHMEIMQDAAHRERLSAAESVLDRTGFGKTQKVQQTTVAQVTGSLALAQDFQGRTVAELEHYATHGKFPGE